MVSCLHSCYLPSVVGRGGPVWVLRLSRSLRGSSAPQLPALAHLGKGCTLGIAKDATLRGLVNHAIRDSSFLHELESREIGRSHFLES